MRIREASGSGSLRARSGCRFEPGIRAAGHLNAPQGSFTGISWFLPIAFLRKIWYTIGCPEKGGEEHAG